MARPMLLYVARRAVPLIIKLHCTSLNGISCSSGIIAFERKFYGTVGFSRPHSEQVASQMIQYALGHARSQKSGDSYAQSLMLLEQGISNLSEDSAGYTSGMLMLAISTLHYERGELQESMERLQMIHQLVNASVTLKVAAWEALIGLNLERGQDAYSLVLANDCFKLLNSCSEDNASTLGVLKSRAKAIKGLTHLILGEIKSAEALFGDCKEGLEDCKDQIGNVALSDGEFLHAIGNLSLANDLYEKVLRDGGVSVDSYLASSNMISEEVLLGATCARGQLLTHSGKFNEAEEMLTKALTNAESHFGLNHYKVGVILTCIALMYKQKSKLEASSAILIQEGLYRRALEKLKAPALDSLGDADRQRRPRPDSTRIGHDVHKFRLDSLSEAGKRDVVALARGGYAEILCIQQSRKREGERMKKWAEAAWTNRRMSLAEALEVSDPSNSPRIVVDTRTCRVL